MRAFMSTRDAEDQRIVAAAISGEALGDLAMTELRGVLAVTEPDGPQTACFGIDRIAASAPSVWRDTLVDALAAFVECDTRVLPAACRLVARMGRS